MTPPAARRILESAPKQPVQIDISRGMFAAETETVRNADCAAVTGRVSSVLGLLATSRGLKARVGSLVAIEGRARVHAEVVGFRAGETLLSPHGSLEGVLPGDPVRVVSASQRVEVGDGLLGRILDGDGRAIDGGAAPAPETTRPLYDAAPRALERRRITEPLWTGVAAIDGLVTVGKGQRMGIFAGSGVGKSVLLGMIARHTRAEVSVIGLVGERGREVREFIERDLGEALARSVVVVATSDEPSLKRVKAAFCATAIAEHFRDQGADVLLMIDSITRLAFAQREIGLSAGEPPATKGYPPSVFNLFPRLLERAGQGRTGSITAFYNVLVEGDDVTDPVADAVRSIIDGHVWLSRDLASRAHFPAIDPLQSTSRVMIDVAGGDHLRRSRLVSRLLGAWRDAEDLVNVGAYARGSNPEIDLAICMKPRIDAFCRQAIEEGRSSERVLADLQAIEEEAAGNLRLEVSDLRSSGASAKGREERARGGS